MAECQTDEIQSETSDCQLQCSTAFKPLKKIKKKNKNKKVQLHQITELHSYLQATALACFAAMLIL